MSQERNKMVTAVFRDRYDAERAFDYLHTLGYTQSEINVLMSDKTRSAYYPESRDESRHEAGSRAAELGVGGAIGTALGATLGAVAAIGTGLLVPGLFFIAGPIAGALAGGGAGAVTGGLIGALVGAGISEQNAEAYADALRNGGVAIAVTPRNSDHAREIERTFKEYNGENVCYC